MSAGDIRHLALTLASHTGWAAAEIKLMPTSEFLWWCEGLPKEDG